MRQLLFCTVLSLSAACATTQAATSGEADKCATHTNIQPALPYATGAVKAFAQRPTPGQKALCAVTGESFEVTETTSVREYQGQWYAFCCDGCLPEFDADPAKFAIRSSN